MFSSSEILQRWRICSTFVNQIWPAAWIWSPCHWHCCCLGADRYGHLTRFHGLERLFDDPWINSARGDTRDQWKQNRSKTNCENLLATKVEMLERFRGGKYLFMFNEQGTEKNIREIAKLSVQPRTLPFLKMSLLQFAPFANYVVK